MDDGGALRNGMDQTRISFAVNINPIIENDLFLPTLFSPNNDGNNDVLYLRGSQIESLVFQIYDQNWIKIFETNSKEEIMRNGWDGTTGGKDVPAGSYIWFLQGQFNDGSSLAIDGKNTGIIRVIR